MADRRNRGYPSSFATGTINCTSGNKDPTCTKQFPKFRGIPDSLRPADHRTIDPPRPPVVVNELKDNAMKHLGLVGIACMAAAIASAAPAGAAPQDAAFLNRLNQVGITSSNPYATFLEAYAVCRHLDFGTPHSGVVGIVLSNNPDLDYESAADFVVLANMTYCPPA